MNITTISRIVFLILVTGPTSLFAGSITGVAVSIDRIQDELLNTTYHFNTDIYGTVSEFRTITVTSPLNNSYSLSLSPEGDQWGSGESGSEANITSQFIDGIYRFDVEYTDATTESADAQLGGGYPPFPTSLLLTGNTVSWDSWQNPISPTNIEFYIFEIGGGAELFVDLAFSETSFELPPDFLQSGAKYKLEIWFLSSEFETSHKASVSTITIDLTPICDIQLSQAIYIDGETITADVYRYANLTSSPITLEAKVWWGLPAGEPPISVTNLGSDGSVVLPPGTDVDVGPLPLQPVTSAMARGTYEFSCRMLDPVTGELLAEDRNFFEIQ